MKPHRRRDIRWRSLAAATVLTLSCASTFAQAEYAPADVPEHPVVKFYPGAAIDDFDIKAFDAADMATGYDQASTAVTIETLEGKVSRYNYNHAEGQSALEIIRTYEAALRQAGFSTLIVARVSELRGLEGPRERSYFGAFRADRDAEPPLYVNLEVDPNAGAPWSVVTIVEPKPMAQSLPADAASRAAGLARD